MQVVASFIPTCIDIPDPPLLPTGPIPMPAMPTVPQTAIPCRPGVFCYSRPLKLNASCKRSRNIEALSSSGYKEQVDVMMDKSLGYPKHYAEHGFITDASTGQNGPVFTSGWERSINPAIFLQPNGAPLPQERTNYSHWVFRHSRGLF
jgi:hypothetical protein